MRNNHIPSWLASDYHQLRQTVDLDIDRRSAEIFLYEPWRPKVFFFDLKTSKLSYSQIHIKFIIQDY